MKSIFHPPAGMSRQRYLRRAVIAVTLISVGVSAGLTAGIEQLTATPNLSQGLTVAVVVPLLVVPPLAYWLHSLLFDLETSRKKIHQLSRTDDLTGLLNRGHFFELADHQLALAERHGYPVAMLLIDIDDFKQINDSFGHQTGDAVLHRTAGYLSKAVRGTDLLARYGGEEFVLLMPHTTGEAALALCQRMQQGLASAQNEDLTLPKVTISIGAACSGRSSCDLEGLLSAADQALYQAKAAGKDSSVLAPDGAPVTD